MKHLTWILASILVLAPSALGQREPIPPDAALQKARADIRAADPAAFQQGSSSEQRIKWVKEFRARAQRSDRAANRYAYLIEAREFAIDAGSLELALAVESERAAGFDVNVGEGFQFVLKSIEKATVPAAQTRDNLDFLIDSIEGALQDQELEVAHFSIGVFDRLVTRAEESLQLSSDRIRRLRDQANEKRSWLDRWTEAAARLKADRVDPEAISDDGLYMIVIASNWDAGLKRLSAGATETAQIAAADVAAPVGGDERKELADRWHAAALRESGRTKVAFAQRAIHWYDQALPDLDPAQESLAQKARADLQKMLDGVAKSGLDGVAVQKSKAEALLGIDLIKNGSCEQEPSGSGAATWKSAPSWSPAKDASCWVQRGGALGNLIARSGKYYFWPNSDENIAETYQDVSIGEAHELVDTGDLEVQFRGWAACLAKEIPDRGQVRLEFRDSVNDLIVTDSQLAKPAVDSDRIKSTGDWILIELRAPIPKGTKRVRVWLKSHKGSGVRHQSNDACFDDVLLMLHRKPAKESTGGVSR